MLYNILLIVLHLFYCELPNISYTIRAIRGSVNVNSLSFPLMRLKVFHYSRCFLPATEKLYNKLHSALVEAVHLQKFKHG